MLSVRAGLWATRCGLSKGLGATRCGLSQRLVGGCGQPVFGLSASVHMPRQARQAGAHARNVATAENLASQNFAPRCLIQLDTFRRPEVPILTPPSLICSPA